MCGVYIGGESGVQESTFLHANYGVHAFGYNSVEREPIWMKSGAF